METTDPTNKLSDAISECLVARLSKAYEDQALLTKELILEIADHLEYKCKEFTESEILSVNTTLLKHSEEIANFKRTIATLKAASPDTQVLSRIMVVPETHSLNLEDVRWSVDELSTVIREHESRISRVEESVTEILSTQTSSSETITILSDVFAAVCHSAKLTLDQYAKGESVRSTHYQLQPHKVRLTINNSATELKFLANYVGRDYNSFTITIGDSSWPVLNLDTDRREFSIIIKKPDTLSKDKIVLSCFAIDRSIIKQHVIESPVKLGSSTITLNV